MLDRNSFFVLGRKRGFSRDSGTSILKGDSETVRHCGFTRYLDEVSL